MTVRPPALVVDLDGDVGGWPGPGWTAVGLDELPAAPFDLTERRLVVRAVVEPALAEAVLLAASRGVAVACAVDRDGSWVDAFLDDLGRVATVTLGEGAAALAPDERALLAALAEGATLGEAARLLGMSRRTATRHVAAARRRLGVDSTATAVRRRPSEP